jgi:CxxC-x17-CxxC domain-containing protein
VSFVDKTITCRDCGREFVFSAGEQQFYQTRGLMNEPGRCPECRRARKSGGGGGGYGGGGGQRQRREMFPAVCSSCGKDTQVPFQPRGDKPVYCSDCFESVRGGGGRY